MVLTPSPGTWLAINSKVFLVEPYSPKCPRKKSISFSVTLSEGCYLLRTNLNEADPAKLWKHYIQLTDAEWACRPGDERPDAGRPRGMPATEDASPGGA